MGQSQGKGRIVEGGGGLGEEESLWIQDLHHGLSHLSRLSQLASFTTQSS